MFPLLLAGCSLTQAQPPLELTVPLPTAAHAWSVPTQELLWPHLSPDRYLTDADLMALCQGLDGATADHADRIDALQRDNQLRHTVLEIDQARVLLGGTEVLALEDGAFPASSSQGMLSSPLYDALLERVDAQQGMWSMCGDLASADHPWSNDNRSLLIAAAPDLPYTLLQTVLYTAAQAQISRFYVAVDGPVGPRFAPRPFDDDAQLLTVVFEDSLARTAAHSGRDGDPIQVGDRPLSDLYAELEVEELSCGFVAPDATTPWSAVVNTVAEISQAGAWEVVVSASADASTTAPVAQPAAQPAAPRALEGDVPVLVITLPRIARHTSDRSSRSPCEANSVIERRMAGVIGAPNSEVLNILNDDTLVMTGSGGLGSRGGRLGDGGTASGLGELLASPDAASEDVATTSRVSVTERTIDGPLRPEILNAVLTGHTDALQACHAQSGAAAGEMTVRMVVNSDGTLSEATITESPFASDSLSNCVTEQLAQSQFPRLPGTLTTTITARLSFETE